ncbi:MAG: DUF2382 domain-containing protein [Pyrinomonadaceae bacterium]
MAIVPYTQQDDYDVVHDRQNCIGWTVTDQAGNDVGKVTEMFVNTDTEMVDSIIVDGNTRVPARDIALKDNRVVVRGVLHQEEYERTRSSAVSSTATTDTQNYDESEGETSGKYVKGMTRAANDGEIVLPIIEEQLNVGKRTVESGSAQVRTTVEDVPVEESVNLREEHVTVERRPVDRAVENAPAAFKEGTIEVTEMAEVPVVSKEARVVEEVVIGKEVIEREQTVSDTVKRTEVDIDRTGRTDNIDRNRN